MRRDAGPFAAELGTLDKEIQNSSAFFDMPKQQKLTVHQNSVQGNTRGGKNELEQTQTYKAESPSAELEKEHDERL